MAWDSHRWIFEAKNISSIQARFMCFCCDAIYEKRPSPCPHCLKDGVLPKQMLYEFAIKRAKEEFRKERKGHYEDWKEMENQLNVFLKSQGVGNE